MSGRLASFAIVVAALTCYHVAQRSIPESVRPAPLFAFVYGTATLGMLTVVTVSASTGRLSEAITPTTHWAPWLLAAAVAGIELGVYAMYRSGWSIGTASTSTQATVAAILVVLGLVHFGEHITPVRAAGLALCVVGAGLVVR